MFGIGKSILVLNVLSLLQTIKRSHEEDCAEEVDKPRKRASEDPDQHRKKRVKASPKGMALSSLSFVVKKCPKCPQIWDVPKTAHGGAHCISTLEKGKGADANKGIVKGGAQQARNRRPNFSNHTMAMQENGIHVAGRLATSRLAAMGWTV